MKVSLPITTVQSVSLIKVVKTCLFDKIIGFPYAIFIAAIDLGNLT